MPEDIRNFDAIEWINRFFQGASLNFEQLRPILCFSLIWNLFEAKACGRHANKNSIRRSVDSADESGRLKIENYQKYLDFFRERYVENNTVDAAFDRLLMQDSDSKEVVRRSLLGESHDINNILFGLLLIAHRIRNNLFHGNKDVETLPRQTELFVVVNSLLAKYLEDIENLPQRERLLLFEGREAP